MPVYLQDNNGQAVTSNKIKLESFGSVYQTTKNPSSGRWYFEFTHEGGSYFHIPCWCYPNYKQGHYLCFYQQGNSNSFKIHFGGNSHVYSNDTQTALEKYHSLSFSKIVSGYTVGLAFDTNADLFSIYYGGYVNHFNVKFTSFLKDKKITPYFIENTNGDNYYSDIISVAFEEKDFKYNVPIGYLPWGKQCLKKTPISIPTFIHFRFFTIIILFEGE